MQSSLETKAFFINLREDILTLQWPENLILLGQIGCMDTRHLDWSKTKTSEIAQFNQVHRKSLFPNIELITSKTSKLKK